MNKLVGLSGIRNLENFKSLSGSASATAKTYSSARTSSESVSYGSFANLKLTAEKLVKEQASAKTDLELANSKLKKLTEHIHALEEKLQNAFNENAKLNVKHKEDEKLWKGLESKFTSTKTLCDQLTETLQQLAGQVHDAEKDKKFFEDKLCSTAASLDNLHDQMNALSLRLESSEEAVRNREKELAELRVEKAADEQSFRDEQIKASNLIVEKDALIKDLEETVGMNQLNIGSLNTKMEELQLNLRLKDEDLKQLRISEEILKKDKADLLSSNENFARKLDMALKEIWNLENFVNLLAANLNELDKQSLDFSDKLVQLNSLYDSCFKLVKEEKHMSSEIARKQHNQLEAQSFLVVSEKEALQLVNQELNYKITDLQKLQEQTMVQHAEECCQAEERIQRLQSEIQNHLAKRSEKELLVTQLEEKISTLSESSSLSESNMQDLLSKFKVLESESKDSTEKLQEEIQKKEEEVDILKKEIEKHNEHVDFLEKQVTQFQCVLEEKDNLILQFNDKEKQLEDERTEVQKSLIDAESKLAEAKKQYDLMLESKQLELSRHLKELSLKNDQAINDIRRKFEAEKLESVNMEKAKADKAVQEMVIKCEQKLAECNEESQKHLMRIKEEHAALITHIQHEHDMVNMELHSNHRDELKRAQLQAESQLREKITVLRNEHEVQLEALKGQHEDECKKLNEELDIQKSKEDRQRALLQLQWRVMGNNQQEDQEVDSKKNYSVSTTKMRNSDAVRRNQHAVDKAHVTQKLASDSPYVIATQTPVSNLLKKVDKNNESVMSIPKHSRKVTHHEYEVETSTGGIVTKRRKTKSTVMFGDPRKHKKRVTPKAATPKGVVKVGKGGNIPASNIGDLFSEGSLNPYADDPYAFD